MTKLPSQCHKSLWRDQTFLCRCSTKEEKEQFQNLQYSQKIDVEMEGTICVNSVLETSTVSFLNEGTNPAPVNLLSTLIPVAAA